MSLSNIHKALLQAALNPTTNRSVSLQSSWEWVHGSVPKDICIQQGGKAMLSTVAPRNHHPQGTNTAGCSSTAPHDHTGLLTGIEQPWLQKHLEEDCMAVTQAHIQPEDLLKLFQASTQEWNEFPHQLQFLMSHSQSWTRDNLSLPGLCPPCCSTFCELLWSYSKRGMVGD